MSLARYFLDIEDRVPARWATVFERGAVVNGAQEGTSVTVHAGHDFAANDKCLIARARDNIEVRVVYTISVAAATSLTVTPAMNLSDKDMLVNIGPDSGGTQRPDGSYNLPNWDGSSVDAYKDPNGDTAWSDSNVDVDPGGEVGFWGTGQTVWLLVRDNSTRPKRLYPDVGSPSGVLAGGDTLPSVGTPNQLFAYRGGAGQPTIIYAYVYFDDDTLDWMEMGRAET